MSDFEEIRRVLVTTESWFDSVACQSVLASEGDRRRGIEINRYAYFVLLFAQLERNIKEAFDRDIGGDPLARLEHRVDVLFDSGSPAAERIMDLYWYRCEIAHGNVAPEFWPRFSHAGASTQFVEDIEFLRGMMRF